MHKFFLRTGIFLAMLAVIFGAFGAHSLKSMVDASSVAVFETGVRYQMYHAFALIITGILTRYFSSPRVVNAGYAFIIGVVLFSGSLYLLTFFKTQGVVGMTGIGLLTPLGGVAFVIGWLMLFLGLRKIDARF